MKTFKEIFIQESKDEIVEANEREDKLTFADFDLDAAAKTLEKEISRLIEIPVKLTYKIEKDRFVKFSSQDLVGPMKPRMFKKLNVVEVVSVNSITAKTRAEELEIKARTRKINLEIKLLKKDFENKLKLNNKSQAIFQMMILSGIMSTTIGNGESFSSPRLFSEDDLIEYKQKMQELLKIL